MTAQDQLFQIMTTMTTLHHSEDFGSILDNSWTGWSGDGCGAGARRPWLRSAAAQAAPCRNASSSVLGGGRSEGRAEQDCGAARESQRRRTRSELGSVEDGLKPWGNDGLLLDAGMGSRDRT